VNVHAQPTHRLHLFDPASTDAPFTVADVIDARRAHLDLRVRLGKLKPKSRERDLNFLPKFATDHPAKPVDTCVQEDLLTWLAAHPEWKADSTIRDALAAVIGAFRWAFRDVKLIAWNPYEWPREIRLHPKIRPAMERAEYLAMMVRARPKRQRPRKSPGSPAFRIALKFLWESGPRPDEMRRVQWLHVDWAGVIDLGRESKTFAATGDIRLIPLSNRLLRLLRWLHRKRQPKPGDLVFLNGDGEPWKEDTWEQHFRRWARRAGIPKEKSSYGLRHGFSVAKLEEGRSNKEVADALGHKSTRMVDACYGAHTRTRVEYLRKIVNPAEK